MKVMIAMASGAGQISGVQRHAMNAARCLLTRQEVESVNLIVAPWQEEFVRGSVGGTSSRLDISVAPIKRSAWSRNYWYFARLPKVARAQKADIVHLAYPAPIRGRDFHCPVVMTLHDLYPYDIPENFGFPKVLFNRYVLDQCLSEVDAIACVSQGTLLRMRSLKPEISIEKAAVVPNCVEASSEVSVTGPLKGWDGESFLLCVAQHRHNKNLLFLLQVFERLLREERVSQNTRLVIVGIEGPETKHIHRFLQESQLMGNVDLLHGISDAELAWCYGNCSLLVAPSTFEGFGLPVAEALLAGCKVVCSDIPAFREIGGDVCHYVRLDDCAADGFVRAISQCLMEDTSQPRLLPQLSSSAVADGYLQLYHSLIASMTTGKLSPVQVRTGNKERDLCV